MADQKNETQSPGGTCVRPPNGPNAEYFPNLPVTTHENRKALFYDDLLRGKTVLIQFMSIKDDDTYRFTANIAKVQQLLGDRLGRDVFIYSITTDPANDRPRDLAALAEKHGAQDGWLFLTGEPAVLQRIQGSFFARNAPVGAHDHAEMEDCSIGVIRYGNEAAGTWSSCPAHTDPEWIAQRVSWVQSRDVPVGFKRRGPAPLPETITQGDPQ
jgi:protein SCO1/2